MVKVHGCLIVYENNNPMNFPITYNLYPITHLLNSQTYYPLGMLIEVSKEIPLNRSALHWLPEAKRMQADQKVFELTILGVCNRYLKKMAADAGITKNVSFHTSRHTFAVLTLAAGSDLYTVGKLLGHTSINSTQVYADVVMETKFEAISRISNYFSNL